MFNHLFIPLIFYRQKFWLKASATVGQWWQRQQQGTIITPGLGHPAKVSLHQFNIIIPFIIFHHLFVL
jgi:hypothetical protein